MSIRDVRWLFKGKVINCFDTYITILAFSPLSAGPTLDANQTFPFCGRQTTPRAPFRSTSYFNFLQLRGACVEYIIIIRLVCWKVLFSRIDLRAIYKFCLRYWDRMEGKYRKMFGTNINTRKWQINT